MNLVKQFTASLLAIVVLSGCQQPTYMYQWGTYQDHLHQSYVLGSNTTPLQTAEQLHGDITATLESGNIVPPGKYAHLGYLYFQAAEINTAIDFLNKEKAAYPESTTFVDTLLKNVKATQQ